MIGFKTLKLEIATLADIPSGTWLGSSGSFITPLLKALCSHRRELVHRNDLAELACEIEVNRFREPMGKQDQFIAAYGGVACFSFHPDEKVEAEPLSHNGGAVQSRGQPTVVFRRLRAQRWIHPGRPEGSDPEALMRRCSPTLHYVKKLGTRSQMALDQGDTSQFGALMHEQGEHKKRRSGRMNSPQIDECYELGGKNGAIGGKLVGAGGGGFLIFYAEDHRRLWNGMSKVGA